MGRRKFRLSYLPKNLERKNKGQRPVGRPCKNPSVSDNSDTTTSISSHHSVSSPGSSTDNGVDSVSSDVDSLLLTNSSENGSFSSISSSDEVSSSLMPLNAHCSQSNHTLASPDFYNPAADISSLTGSLEALVRNFVLPSNQWIIKGQGMNNIAVYKTSTHPSSPLVVTHSVRIQENLSWNLFVHGSQVDSLKCTLLTGIPEILSPSSLEEFLKLLDKYNICPGNPDSGCIEMVEAKKGAVDVQEQTKPHSNCRLLFTGFF